MNGFRFSEVCFRNKITLLSLLLKLFTIRTLYISHATSLRVSYPPFLLQPSRSTISPRLSPVFRSLLAGGSISSRVFRYVFFVSFIVLQWLGLQYPRKLQSFFRVSFLAGDFFASVCSSSRRFP